MVNNIFGSSKTGDEFKDKIDIQSKAILTVVERQKELESSTDLISEKLELLDHNTILNFKKIFSEIKSLRDDLRETKQEIANIREFNIKMVKQIKLMSSKDEVMKLEKYIDLWNPMDFISREEFMQSKKQIFKDLLKEIENFLKK